MKGQISIFDLGVDLYGSKECSVNDDRVAGTDSNGCSGLLLKSGTRSVIRDKECNGEVLQQRVGQG